MHATVQGLCKKLLESLYTHYCTSRDFISAGNSLFLLFFFFFNFILPSQIFISPPLLKEEILRVFNLASHRGKQKGKEEELRSVRVS